MCKADTKLRCLSAFAIKILACLFMLIDHIGVMFFPQCQLMRIVGRLAYPLFAYFIAEGCRYTKNKTRRFLSVFLLGAICEFFYVATSGDYYGNILLTFSLSILLIYLLQYVKKTYLSNKTVSYLSFVLFLFSVVCVYFFCKYIGVDYGFFGVITPLLVTLFDDVTENAKDTYNLKSKRLLSLCGFFIGLVLLSFVNPVLDCQVWCLLSVFIVALYNGERGRYNFKYGFYLFYPLHMVALEAILMVVEKHS